MIALVEEKLDMVKELCSRRHIKRLEIFGSAVEGIFYPETSDLDFVVEFQPDADLGPWLSGYHDFKSDLERVFDRKVDLIMKKALKNPHFIKRVNRSRRVIYEG